MLHLYTFQLTGLTSAILKRLGHEKKLLAHVNETRMRQLLLFHEGYRTLFDMADPLGQWGNTTRNPASMFPRFCDDMVPLFPFKKQLQGSLSLIMPASTSNRFAGLSYWFDYPRQELTLRLSIRGPHR